MTTEDSDQKRLAAIFHYVVASDFNVWSKLSEAKNEPGFPVWEFENSVTHAKVTVSQLDNEGLFNVKGDYINAYARFPANW